LTDPYFDRQDQLDKITGNLLPEETIIAVYDCIGVGTGFIGVTNRRIILQDNSFVGGKVALTSIPYGKIQSLSFCSDKSMFGKFASSSSIALITSGKVYEATFRTIEKAKHIHDVALHYLFLS